MPKTAIIVPCRLESTRFPRKLLHMIKGRPLVLWVADRISREAPEYSLHFAVDHELLRECVTGAGYQAIMTSALHESGTDRIAEANRTVRAEHVINVQADEPLVTGRHHPTARVTVAAHELGGRVQHECDPGRRGLLEHGRGEGRVDQHADPTLAAHQRRELPEVHAVPVRIGR